MKVTSTPMMAMTIAIRTQLWANPCSSKPTMNGKSTTNATSPKPPWPYSSNPAITPSRMLPIRPRSRHSARPQKLRQNALLD